MHERWSRWFPNLFGQPEWPEGGTRPTTAPHHEQPVVQPQPVKGRGTIVFASQRRSDPVVAGSISLALVICWAIALSVTGALAILIAVFCTIVGILLAFRLIRDPIPKPDEMGEISPPETPSKRVARYLAANEVLLWEGREHPISLWKWALGALGLQAMTLGIGTLSDSWKAPAILWFVGMVVIGVRTLLWDLKRICITNSRLFTIDGIVRITRRMMPLSKLTDMTTRTSATSTTLTYLRLIRAPYATLIVESAGQDQALSRIEYVPNGELVNKLIVGMVSKPIS